MKYIFGFVIIAILCCGGISIESKPVKVLALGPEYAIHQFPGFVEQGMGESIINLGIAVSHTNLKTGEMKWLVATGVIAAHTRRISYSVSRLVGLQTDREHLITLIYSIGRLFTPHDEPPYTLPPKKGQYTLQIFTKKDGVNIYTKSFTDSQLFPDIVPVETIKPGIISQIENGYVVFDSLFKQEKEGEWLSVKYQNKK
ncbi:hypothetical protein [Candidatus Uabimicrobium sp. HlEnr_7]|uniref:hypothetical protein n=1 Tax=Candidatus Uabimicrobium helgolandensis TaxID=3095367 RepID=UPI003556FC98